MIVAATAKPPEREFAALMSRTDQLLNGDAACREDYYTHRGGKLLESDVYDALVEQSKGTPFQGSIELVSGASFPDIVVNRFYGVEVKSTEKNQWKSIGSSILESTRSKDVERIYLTFGKLGKPVSFLSRPYQDCLCGISVTHYPRYQIDMQLQEGETIFDQMGIDYDHLRKMDNPAAPVAHYYQSKLKEGESLWWAPSGETEAPPVVRLWTSLGHEEKELLAIQGYVYYPEILGKSPQKYNRYALWLAIQKSVLCTNVRDSFSAGGQVMLRGVSGLDHKMPAAYGRIKKYSSEIVRYLSEAEHDDLMNAWRLNDIADCRLSQWIDLVSHEAAQTAVGYAAAYDVLRHIFGLWL